jgi:hypothetical protein
MLNEDLLKETTLLLGQKTYSATVNAALEEIVRQKHVEGLADFVGKIAWIGNLSEMRNDNPRKQRRTQRRKKARVQ